METHLTDDNLELFRGFYNERFLHQNQLLLKDFFKMDISLQIGVYLAYYDSLDIRIMIIPFNSGSTKYFDIEIEPRKKYGQPEISYFKSRNEAYKEAFKKANEIINNN